MKKYTEGYVRSIIKQYEGNVYYKDILTYWRQQLDKIIEGK